MSELQIFITDDHSMFRSGIVNILNSSSGLSIIGEASGPQETLKSPALPNTDLLLLDLSLQKESGLDFIPDLKLINPKLKILILSMHNKPVLIKNAINSGIDGYVVKHSHPEVLLQAIEKVVKGVKFLDPALSESLFFLLSESVISGNCSTRYNTLSKREQEVFRLIAEGLNTHQIARKLYISKKTADNHRLNLMNKLKLHSIPDLIAAASELGVI